MEDLNGTPIEGQIYQEEKTRFRVTRRTVYKIDKIMNKRDRRGKLQYLVRWRGYSKTMIPGSRRRAGRRRQMSNIDPTHFYVTLLSNTSKSLYPDNTIAAFTAELARPVELGYSDNWEVGVCEFSSPPNSVGTFKHTTVVGDTTEIIYCDLISPQYVGRALFRFMRTFIYPSLSGQHVFDYVYYLPVDKRTFKSIRREILQLTGKPVEFKSSTTPSKVVLHFRRVSAW